MRHNSFHSPFSIFIRPGVEEYGKILDKRELNHWNTLDQTEFDSALESSNRHFYTTWIDGWLHIMDDWMYTLWLDKELTHKMLNLSKEFDVFTCSVGDIDHSFAFHFMKKGEYIREFVVEDPEFNGGEVRRNIGVRLAGERRRLFSKKSLSKGYFQ